MTPPALAFREHPAVMAASFDFDVATTIDPRRRKQPDADDHAAGQRQPQQGFGSHARYLRDRPGLGDRPAYRSRSMTAALAASQTRQAKEVAGAEPAGAGSVPQPGPTAAVGAWVANEGAKIAVTASESEVCAATVALQGVQREAAGGQRAPPSTC